MKHIGPAESTAARDIIRSSKRALDPIDRISEVLFGLIMVLSFTGSLSVAEAGRTELRTMLLAALGCNLAWGIIDGVLYLMGCLAEKSRFLIALRAVREAADPRDAHAVLAGTLPSAVSSVLRAEELEAIRGRLAELSEPPPYERLDRDDWRGAAAVFLLVFLSTLPVVVPFAFLKDIALALRISNAIAIAMLAATGYAFGRTTGRRPWTTAVSMVILGLALVVLTMALGG